MAQPIPFDAPRGDAHVELAGRLHDAPAEHAEALLALYAVAQGLHDRGVLELLRGALGSGDALVAITVDAARGPGVIRAARNLFLLADALAAIQPSLLADVTRAVPVALEQASAEEARPPGLLKLLRTFFDKDFRRGLAAANDLFIALGKNLSKKEQR